MDGLGEILWLFAAVAAPVLLVALFGWFAIRRGGTGRARLLGGLAAALVLSALFYYWSYLYS